MFWYILSLPHVCFKPRMTPARTDHARSNRSTFRYILSVSHVCLTLRGRVSRLFDTEWLKWHGLITVFHYMLSISHIHFKHWVTMVARTVRNVSSHTICVSHPFETLSNYSGKDWWRYFVPYFLCLISVWHWGTILARTDCDVSLHTFCVSYLFETEGLY